MMLFNIFFTRLFPILFILIFFINKSYAFTCPDGTTPATSSNGSGYSNAGFQGSAVTKTITLDGYSYSATWYQSSDARVSIESDGNVISEDDNSIVYGTRTIWRYYNTPSMNFRAYWNGNTQTCLKPCEDGGDRLNGSCDRTCEQIGQRTGLDGNCYPPIDCSSNIQECINHCGGSEFVKAFQCSETVGITTPCSCTEKPDIVAPDITPHDITTPDNTDTNQQNITDNETNGLNQTNEKINNDILKANLENNEQNEELISNQLENQELLTGLSNLVDDGFEAVKTLMLPNTDLLAGASDINEGLNTELSDIDSKDEESKNLLDSYIDYYDNTYTNIYSSLGAIKSIGDNGLSFNVNSTTITPCQSTVAGVNILGSFFSLLEPIKPFISLFVQFLLSYIGIKIFMFTIALLTRGS